MTENLLALQSRCSAYEVTLGRMTVVCLTVAGTLIGLTTGRPEWMAAGAPLALAFYSLAFAVWLGVGHWPQHVVWFATVAFAAAIFLLQVQVQTGVLNLLVVPPILAAASCKRKAMAQTAALETLLLAAYALLGNPAVSGVDVALTSGLIWACVGAVWLIYQPAREMVSWSWDHYAQNQGLLEEARNQRGNFLQALDDLAHSNRQMALLNERLAVARRMAEDAEKAKADFVANVSHELRTPLNMIIGLTDLMIVKPQVYGSSLPDLLMEDLRIVHRNCEHLSSLINDVLDISQIEAEHMGLRKEHVLFSDVVAKAVDIVLPLVHKKRLSFAVDLPPQDFTVYCDRTRIRQVIVNLISNAARYTDCGGIRVAASIQGPDVVVTVADSGPGIAPADLKQVFEPFFQSESSRRWRGMGSGLGLSISKQFVELHQGQIWVESTLGKGSAFYVRLPLQPADEPAAGAGRWLAPEWEWRQRLGERTPQGAVQPSLVICDAQDEFAAMLSRHGGAWQVYKTQEITQALAAVEAHSPVALLINGASEESLLCQVAQATCALADLPVLGFVTARHRRRSSADGWAEYLVKPVIQADLLKAVEGLEMTVSRVLVVDDDLDAQRLFVRFLMESGKVMTVDAVATGRNAIDAARSGAYDLVLLDVVLPDMDGYAVLDELRREESTRSVPVIMISAQDVTDEPMRSSMVMTAQGQGLSVGKVLRAIEVLPRLLTEGN